MSRRPPPDQSPSAVKAARLLGGRSLPAAGEPSSKKKRKPSIIGPPPPIGMAYLLRSQDVAVRLRMSVNRAWHLRKADPRFPKPVTPPGCRPMWLESDVARYVTLLAEERDAKLERSA